jgi:TolB-like protein
MMATRVLWVAALVAVFIGMAAAQVKNVAVVETEVDAQSGAAAKLNKAEVRQITAVLRKEALKNLPQERYNIMTSETVQAQGGATLEECADENCVITLGSKIGADFIVRGTISKFGTKITVSVDIYETNDGNLVASSELVRSENTAELLDGTARACGDMYKVFLNVQTQRSKQKAATTQPAQPVTPPAQPAVTTIPQPTYQPPAPAYQPSAPTPMPVPTYQQPGVDGSKGLRFKVKAEF